MLYPFRGGCLRTGNTVAGGQSKPIFWWGKKARTTKRIMLGMLRLACVKPD